MDHDEIQVAVACDRCNEDKNCLHLCCPIGKSYSFDYTDDFDPIKPDPDCQEHGSDFVIDGKIKNLTSYSMNSNLLLLVGPTTQSMDNNEYIFNCPVGTELNLDYYSNITLDSEGNLISNNEANPTIFKPGYYCLALEDGITSFETCKVKEFNKNVCELARDVTFQLGYILSAVSILVAIIIKYADGSINNKETSHGKVEFIYLLNILCFYGLLILLKFYRFKPFTIGCELYAYCIQYFKLSVFFTINLLAYSLSRIVIPKPDPDSVRNTRFSDIEKRISPLLYKFPKPERKHFIFIGTIYAQGAPLLICLVTFCIDAYRKSFLSPEDDKTSFPQAGVAKNCLFFYANPDSLNRKSYISTPDFIYIQSFQLFIILLNIFLLVITTNSYIQRQLRLRELQQRDLNQKSKYVVYIKWFVYTVAFWIFEIVTSAIVAVYGIQNTCILRNVALP